MLPSFPEEALSSTCGNWKHETCNRERLAATVQKFFCEVSHLGIFYSLLPVSLKSLHKELQFEARYITEWSFEFAGSHNGKGVTHLSQPFDKAPFSLIRHERNQSLPDC